jgi:hypothetical protein
LTQNGRRATPPAEPGVGKGLARIATWLETARAARQRPALRVPRRSRIEAPKPRWLSCFWATRLAVRAGIGLRDFLQHRLSYHLGTSSVPPGRLPVSISIEEGGAIVCRPPDGPSGRAPWLESFLRAEGSAALGPEIQLAHANVARLAGRIETQRRRVDEMARELEATTRATELVDPDDGVQAQRMGRPPVPLPLGLALQLLAFALLLAETWHLAIPCLEAGGVRTRELAGELQRNPGAVVLGSIFALGASVSLFVLAHVALQRGLDLLEAQSEASRRVWRATVSLGASALAAAVAWSIVSVRPGTRPVDPGTTRLMLFLVALAIPIATAWLLRLAWRLQDARNAALVLARAWDQEHYRSLMELSRRAAAHAEEERRLACLEGERAAALRRLQALQQRVATAERLAADAAEAEAQELSQLAQALVASLELDRYEYLRQVATRGLSLQRPHGTAPLPAPVRDPRGEGERNLGLAS